MPLFEDIGRAGNVADTGNQVFERAIRLKEAETNQAVTADALQRARELHNYQIKQIQQQEKEQQAAEQLRQTRISVDKTNFYQSLPPETKEGFKYLLNRIEPMDESTGTHSLGSIQNAVGFMESWSDPFKKILGPVVEQHRQNMIASQKKVNELQNKGKTSGKEWEEANAELQQNSKLYAQSNDAWASHVMLQEEIEQRADLQRRNNKEKPENVAKVQEVIGKQLRNQATTLKGLLDVYKPNKEQDNLLGMIFQANNAVAAGEDPQKAYQMAMSGMGSNQAKSVFETLPPDIQESVKEILATMQNLSKLSVGGFGENPLGL